MGILFTDFSSVSEFTPSRNTKFDLSEDVASTDLIVSVVKYLVSY